MGSLRSSVSSVLHLLQMEKRDVLSLVVFSLLAGLFSLVMPVAVQMLVGTVAFGIVSQPLVVLALLVFLVLGVGGGVQLCQVQLVELIQRRMFVRIAQKTADAIQDPSILGDLNESPTLFANRFFEASSVQKSIQVILIDGMQLSITILFGLLLLAVYHPLLLIFDVILICALYFVMRFLGTSAIKTSVEESYKKYAVRSWIEDHFDQTSNSTIDPRLTISEYLKARNLHYRIQRRQLIGLIVIQTLASSTLLAVGGYLVIQGQLTLGQLVAAELVLTGIVSSFSKLSKCMESFYDLTASVGKLKPIFDARSSSKGSETVLADSVYVRTPWYLRKTVRFASVSLALFFLILVFVPWMQTIKGAGRVVAYSPTDRPLKIDVPIDGKIKK